MPVTSPRSYILANCLFYLIGQGVNSKLWPLRVKEKLAYNVNTRLSLFARGGVLEAYLETDSEKKDQAGEAMLNILNELYQNGLTEEDLETTKAYFRGAFLRQVETKENRTNALLYLEAIGLGHEFLDQILHQIDTTTLDEINAFINEHLQPEKRLLVVVGPSDS